MTDDDIKVPWVKIILGFILILIIGLALSWGMGWWGIFYKKTVGAADRDADREVFENTRSYNQGKVQELAKIKAEYDRASEEDKPALAATIRHRFADYDADRLPNGLGSWLRKIRGF